MVKIFEFSDFRSLLQAILKADPKAPRGAKLRLAKELGIHTTTLSQILAGAKPLSLEHAALAADYFSFTELEAEYFLTLVQISKAGNQSLILKLQSQAAKIRSQANELSKTLGGSFNLSLEEQAQFYSDWRFSAMRVLTSIPAFQSLEALAQKLEIDKTRAKKMSDFLISTGLCRLDGKRIVPGPSYTHLPASSPLISKHHGNIRNKAIDCHNRLREEDLSYSSILSISHKDAEKIRTILKDAIETLNKRREQTTPETVHLVGIDWIQI